MSSYPSLTGDDGEWFLTFRAVMRYVMRWLFIVFMFALWLRFKHTIPARLLMSWESLWPPMS